jgi:hypothetical protein
MTQACGTETCPITCDEIGCPDTVVPYAPAGLKPLKAYPDLSCAQLACGHRFHAPALLVHFMRNSLTCPLCRAGANTLPTKSSLPIRLEPWFRQTYDAISLDIEAEEQLAVESDQATAREYVLEQTRSLLRTLPAHDVVQLLHMDEVDVSATVFFYRLSSESPVRLLGMTMPLHLVQPQWSEVRVRVHIATPASLTNTYTHDAGNTIPSTQRPASRSQPHNQRHSQCTLN